MVGWCGDVIGLVGMVVEMCVEEVCDCGECFVGFGYVGLYEEGVG